MMDRRWVVNHLQACIMWDEVTYTADGVHTSHRLSGDASVWTSDTTEPPTDLLRCKGEDAVEELLRLCDRRGWGWHRAAIKGEIEPTSTAGNGSWRIYDLDALS